MADKEDVWQRITESNKILNNDGGDDVAEDKRDCQRYGFRRVPFLWWPKNISSSRGRRFYF